MRPRHQGERRRATTCPSARPTACDSTAIQRSAASWREHGQPERDDPGSLNVAGRLRRLHAQEPSLIVVPGTLRAQWRKPSVSIPREPSRPRGIAERGGGRAPRASRRPPCGQCLEHLRLDPGRFAKEAAEARPGDHRDVHGAGCGHRCGRASPPGDERDLAEEVSGLQGLSRLLADPFRPCGRAPPRLREARRTAGRALALAE